MDGAVPVSPQGHGAGWRRLAGGLLGNLGWPTRIKLVFPIIAVVSALANPRGQATHTHTRTHLHTLARTHTDEGEEAGPISSD